MNVRRLMSRASFVLRIGVAGALIVTSLPAPDLLASGASSFWRGRSSVSTTIRERAESTLLADGLPEWARRLPWSSLADASVCRANRSDEGWVVLLQDVHGDPGVQRTIASVIDALAVEGPVRVGVEGAAAPLRLESLRAEAGPEVRRLLAEHLLGLGWIGGAVYAGLTTSNDVRLDGAEDLRLYNENLRALRRARAVADEADRLRRRREAAARTELANRFGSELRRMEAQRRRYEADGDLIRYAAALSPEAPPSECPGLAGLLAVERSSPADNDAVTRERDAFFNHFSRRASPEERESLAGDLKSLTHGGGVAEGLLESIRRRAVEMGMREDDYPRFFARMKTMADSRTRLTTQLDAELDRLETAALVRAGADDRARDLWRRLRALGAEERLLTLAARPEEWTSLARAAGRAGADVRDLAPFLDFYRAADARSAVLARRAAKLATARRPAVLVAGGYHAEDAARALTALGRNVLILRPRVARVVRASVFDAFFPDPTPLDRALARPDIFLSPPQLIGLAPSEAPDGVRGLAERRNRYARAVARAIGKRRGDVWRTAIGPRLVVGGVASEDAVARGESFAVSVQPPIIDGTPGRRWSRLWDDEIAVIRAADALEFPAKRRSRWRISMMLAARALQNGGVADVSAELRRLAWLVALQWSQKRTIVDLGTLPDWVVQDADARFAERRDDVVRRRLGACDFQTPREFRTWTRLKQCESPDLPGVLVKYPWTELPEEEKAEIRERYEVAVARLGRFFPATSLIENVDLVIDGKQVHLPFLIVQEKINLVAHEAGHPTDNATNVQRSRKRAEQHTRTFNEMQRRGIVDKDESWRRNFGYRTQWPQELITFDADRFEVREPHSVELLERVREVFQDEIAGAIRELLVKTWSDRHAPAETTRKRSADPLAWNGLQGPPMPLRTTQGAAAFVRAWGERRGGIDGTPESLAWADALAGIALTGPVGTGGALTWEAWEKVLLSAGHVLTPGTVARILEVRATWDPAAPDHDFNLLRPVALLTELLHNGRLNDGSSDELSRLAAALKRVASSPDVPRLLVGYLRELPRLIFLSERGPLMTAARAAVDNGLLKPREVRHFLAHADRRRRGPTSYRVWSAGAGADVSSILLMTVFTDAVFLDVVGVDEKELEARRSSWEALSEEDRRAWDAYRSSKRENGFGFGRMENGPLFIIQELRALGVRKEDVSVGREWEGDEPSAVLEFRLPGDSIRRRIRFRKGDMSLPPVASEGLDEYVEKSAIDGGVDVAGRLKAAAGVARRLTYDAFDAYQVEEAVRLVRYGAEIEAPMVPAPVEEWRVGVTLATTRVIRRKETPFPESAPDLLFMKKHWERRLEERAADESRAKAAATGIAAIIRAPERLGAEAERMTARPGDWTSFRGAVRQLIHPANRTSLTFANVFRDALAKELGGDARVPPIGSDSAAVDHLWSRSPGRPTGVGEDVVLEISLTSERELRAFADFAVGTLENWNEQRRREELPPFRVTLTPGGEIRRDHIERMASRLFVPETVLRVKPLVNDGGAVRRADYFRAFADDCRAFGLSNGDYRVLVLSRPVFAPDRDEPAFFPGQDPHMRALAEALAAVADAPLFTLRALDELMRAARWIRTSA
jgi:hypothetical protein